MPAPPPPPADGADAPSGPALRGFQKRALRAQAHALKPVVQVAGDGLSEGVIQAVDAALRDHELIKVRLHAPDDKKGTANALAAQTASTLCGVVGHTVILFRPDPDDPQIDVPQRPGGGDR